MCYVSQNLVNCYIAAGISCTATHTHTRLTALCPGLPRWAGTRKVKVKTNLDFTEATDSEWQWHQPGHMQICTLLQTNSTPPLRFLQARCPSCRPTNSVKALKEQSCTANPQENKVTELQHYSRRTCSKLCASNHDTSTKVSDCEVHKIDHQWVSLTT